MNHCFWSYVSEISILHCLSDELWYSFCMPGGPCTLWLEELQPVAHCLYTQKTVTDKRLYILCTSGGALHDLPMAC